VGWGEGGEWALGEDGAGGRDGVGAGGFQLRGGIEFSLQVGSSDLSAANLAQQHLTQTHIARRPLKFLHKLIRRYSSLFQNSLQRADG
jgi:hypothetical protein